MSGESSDTTVEASDPLIGTVLAERYLIEELLGRGGMGTVYRAQHVRMQKTVAVKILHQQMTAVEELVKRFEREAIAASRINHPNVAAATDFGRLENGSLYLVLEYVAGQSLAKVLASASALPVERAAFIGRQIAAALAAAHAVGIVHRDLKPDNVMLIEKHGISDFVKVLDFGIAKVESPTTQAGTQLTRMGSVFGTPKYMAPEQAAGKVVDHRADLYALGLMLYEMLAGKPAFESTEMIALLMMQMTQPPPPLPDHLPAELSELVMELLRKEPEQRTQDAAQVAGRIEAWERAYARGGGRAVAARSSSAEVAPPSSASRGTSALHTASALARSVWTQKLEPGALKLLAWASRRSIKRIPNGVLAGAALLVLALIVFRGSSEAPAALEPRADAKQPAPAASAESPDEGDDEEAEDSEQTRAAEALLDPELRRVIADARRGATSALYALELRPERDRSKHEWLALAQGRLKQRQVADALKAYERALGMDATLASDGRMMAGLRYFAEKESTYETVLEFAAEHMGAPGADLIFHVWASTSRVLPHTQKAGKLLEETRVQKNMSRALSLAMQLRRSPGCYEVKELLPEILLHADDRSLMRLKELAKTDGCGEDKKEDCYPCLRDSSLLKDAITQVQMRGAPRFSRRRWR